MSVLYYNGEQIQGGNLDSIPIVSISYSDYQKLSEAEKKEDVIYLVEDAPNVIPSAWERYSTDEIPVGTWIDGRIVYRRVFVTTAPEAMDNGSAVVVPITSRLEMISLEGVIQQEGGVYVPLNKPMAAKPVNTVIAFAHFVSGEGIRMYVSHEIYAHRPVHLIMEYVKEEEN